MRNLILILVATSFLSGNCALADDTAVPVVEPAPTPAVQVEPIRLDMPKLKSRRKMLFQFGMFGTGFHLGWKRPKEDGRGFGSPIIFTSVGQKAIGLGTK